MENKPFSDSMLAKILKSRKFLITFGLLAAVFCPIAALASQIKDTHDPYLALTLLNSDMKIGNYFANNTISEQDNSAWYLDVQNGMDKTEYVAVKIKLLNSTQLSPDDMTNSPSPERELVEYRQALSPYSHWQKPLNWTVLSMTKVDNDTTINKMKINDQIIDNLDIHAVEGKDFRIVIELWKYENDTGDFAFSWHDNSGEIRSVWNQVWFHVGGS
jgi:hypothetical protein